MNEFSDTCVYSMTHGPACEWLWDYALPLELGADTRFEFRYELRDNLGEDHISYKDKLYCELTGLYWMWKNDCHKITGLSHYRRVFPIDKNNIEKILQDYDIITPIYAKAHQSIAREYMKCHVADDWNIMLDVLKQLYPMYHVSAKKIFSKKNYLPCNMFICKHDLMNSYCAWLFPILFEIESRMDLSNRSAYQARAIGFLAERLFTLYVLHNKLKVKHIPILSFTVSGDSNQVCWSVFGSETFNYLLSTTTFLNYHDWKENNKSLSIHDLHLCGNESVLKKMAAVIYHPTSRMFYLLCKAYCRLYS